MAIHNQDSALIRGKLMVQIEKEEVVPGSQSLVRDKEEIDAVQLAGL